MKENRKLLKEVLKDIQHDMTDEEVLNLLADSKISENPTTEKSVSYTHLALSASTDMASRIASTFFISQTSFPQGMFRLFELLSV